jgi:hypothetical protein
MECHTRLTGGPRVVVEKQGFFLHQSCDANLCKFMQICAKPLLHVQKPANGTAGNRSGSREIFNMSKRRERRYER